MWAELTVSIGEGKYILAEGKGYDEAGEGVNYPHSNPVWIGQAPQGAFRPLKGGIPLPLAWQNSSQKHPSCWVSASKGMTRICILMEALLSAWWSFLCFPTELSPWDHKATLGTGRAGEELSSSQSAELGHRIPESRNGSQPKTGTTSPTMPKPLPSSVQGGLQAGNSLPPTLSRTITQK